MACVYFCHASMTIFKLFLSSFFFKIILTAREDFDVKLIHLIGSLHF